MTRPEDELKRLLLAAELDLLERLRERCDHLETRVGDDPAMQESVRSVIVEVLRETGVQDHDRMARILAPLVLSSMREEIRNSSDMMVDALYPITGRLVAAAVRNAFRELMETLNEKLDDSFSLDRWKIRLQAKTTGRSEAELLLQRHPPFEIADLLLIQRQTGLLIARAGDDQQDADGPGGARVDSDLVGGMLTAIMSFTRDAMGSGGTSELRTLSFGDTELFLRTSPTVILAVQARGTPPAGFEGALEELFGAFLERWGGLLRDYDGAAAEDETRPLIIDLRERFADLETARRRNFRGRSHKGYAALAAAVLLFIAWFGYASYQSWKIAGIEATARQVVAAEPGFAGYPFTLRYDQETEVLRVEGLLSDAAAQAKLESTLESALPEVDTAYRLAALPRGEIDRLAEIADTLAGRLAQLEKTTGNLEARATSFENSFEVLSGSLDTQLDQFERKAKDLEGMASGLESSINSVSEGLGGELEKQTGDLKSLAGEIESSVDTWSQTLGAELGRLDQRLAALEQAGPTPLDQLRDWTTRHHIFFGDGTTLRSPDAADAKLRDLSALLLAAPADVRLRVVGYTDPSGSPSRNRKLSLDRAQSIAALLNTMNIPSERLRTAGRSAQLLLSATQGTESENRRVEFELMFPGDS